MKTLTFSFIKQSKNYSVYNEVGGFNKLYLPLSITQDTITVEVKS